MIASLSPAAPPQEPTLFRKTRPIMPGKYWWKPREKTFEKLRVEVVSRGENLYAVWGGTLTTLDDLGGYWGTFEDRPKGKPYRIQ